MGGKPQYSLALRAGEWVQVRTKDEILSTLDSHGRLDELPFMPEMLRYCGKTFRVGKRAHKTCDPAMGIGGRKMTATVHLENLRCDGAAHDGCDARCLIFWKEAWLKRVDPAAVGADNIQKSAAPTPTAECTEDMLFSNIKITSPTGDNEPIYTCQNTQVKFASQPVKWWDVRQYVEDYTSGNVTLRQLIDGAFYTIWRTLTEAGIGLGSAMRWSYDTIQRAVGGSPYPLRLTTADKAKTPKVLLDLTAGEHVRVKPFRQILNTLDSKYRNRGLYFDPDYVPFTERQYKVECRVRQIIDERTGKMIRFSSDAIILENVVCEGKFAVCRRFCPRAIVPFWREVWLERVSEGQLDQDQNPKQPVAAIDQQN